MLRGYADIISENREVVRANSRRFRTSLTALLIALASLALSVLYVVTDLGTVAEFGVLLPVFTSVGVVARYILGGGYLTRNPQPNDNE
jgi:uncharacterized membrane protein